MTTPDAVPDAAPLAPAFRQAQYLISAPTLALCPLESGREVAFAGRSNAGKSSAINALTGNHKLARTSKTPGRTQLINFFSLGTAELRLVDLPGYGYAKVPQHQKEAWQRHLSEYLEKRQTLVGLVLLMDCRHPLQAYDQSMLDWAAARQKPVHLVLTKADKLKRGPAKSTLMGVERYIRDAKLQELVTVQLLSTLSGDGVDQLEAHMRRWLASHAEDPLAVGE